MTVKDRVGRHRYVAFEVTAGPPPTKEEVIQAVRRLARDYPRDMKPWVVTVEGRWGLLRCSHRFKDQAIEMLRNLGRPQGLARDVRTLGTSGTIRGARDRYLRQPG